MPCLILLSFEERCSYCSEACASTCPATRQLQPSFPIFICHLDPFPASYPSARYLGFGPPTCSNPTRFEAKARSLICQGKATRRNATQRNAKQCFQNGARRNGLWIVRKRTPRTFGGALPYLMPSMPWSVPCLPPPDRSSLNLPLRNNQS